VLPVLTVAALDRAMMAVPVSIVVLVTVAGRGLMERSTAAVTVAVLDRTTMTAPDAVVFESPPHRGRAPAGLIAASRPHSQPEPASPAPSVG
jgi:hypothetical protein